MAKTGHDSSFAVWRPSWASRLSSAFLSAAILLELCVHHEGVSVVLSDRLIVNCRAFPFLTWLKLTSQRNSKRTQENKARINVVSRQFGIHVCDER
jgi:hypothetical protein